MNKTNPTLKGRNGIYLMHIVWITVYYLLCINICAIHTFEIHETVILINCSSVVNILL